VATQQGVSESPKERKEERVHMILIAGVDRLEEGWRSDNPDPAPGIREVAAEPVDVRQEAPGPHHDPLGKSPFCVRVSTRGRRRRRDPSSPSSMTDLHAKAALGRSVTLGSGTTVWPE
jgi:hypothetical protein